MDCDFNCVENKFRRNAIFANMPFQLVASILMIITLYIYYGYETGYPDQATVDKARKNKDIAITLFYISRFLSGFAAGMFIFICYR
jgi:hypothetical protein